MTGGETKWPLSLERSNLVLSMLHVFCYNMVLGLIYIRDENRKYGTKHETINIPMKICMHRDVGIIYNKQ